MPPKTHIIKINLPGGIVSAGDLLAILDAAESADVEHLQFGNRQQILFTVADEKKRGLQQQLASADIIYELSADVNPNIVSSYVTEDVFEHANWLREGVYKDILDLFDYRPQLKINLIDNNQTFIPFFSGNLNFIASDTNNYWYLYVRFPKTNSLYCWPSLVYSEDIPSLSSAIERVIFAHQHKFYDQPSADGALLYGLVSAAGGSFVLQPITVPLKVPTFTLPYYEGFNRYGNKLWLGIYRRDELFSVAFLKDLCKICLKTRIGQLYTTPWKSIIVKGIELGDRGLWDTALCKHRINVRHAANELNWQVEDLCEQGLALKYELVRQFNEEDVRTFHLCFAIKTQPKTGLFGSIVIRSQQHNPNQIGLREEQFEILHTRDFNPNSKDFISFRQKVNRESLSWYLIQLCNQFYELQTSEDLGLSTFYAEEPAAEPAESPVAPTLYQCTRCLTIYDQTYGDELNEVAPGTPFEAIVSYCCPTCEAPKEAFAVVAAANAAA
ncbi:rubredoxin domain-containing protein [Hymenobacter crusticola]|uniref:Rubredoxin n=1 Tax=Hymenobacter crusticola TaxID=1770526 RepID=A0A243W856_9BACT|nr:rubredoxin domain-containing protein [Hymenobacter crusticola]OUJ71100.1 rubredoxin [Hymenobacter crusticola]